MLTHFHRIIFYSFLLWTKGIKIPEKITANEFNWNCEHKVRMFGSCCAANLFHTQFSIRRQPAVRLLKYLLISILSSIQNDSRLKLFDILWADSPSMACCSSKCFFSVSHVQLPIALTVILCFQISLFYSNRSKIWIIFSRMNIFLRLIKLKKNPVNEKYVQ